MEIQIGHLYAVDDTRSYMAGIKKERYLMMPRYKVGNRFICELWNIGETAFGGNHNCEFNPDGTWHNGREIFASREIEQ